MKRIEFTLTLAITISFFLLNTNYGVSGVMKSHSPHKNDTKSLYSDKQLGYFEDKGEIVFRLFAPRANKVALTIFNSTDDFPSKYVEHPLKKSEDGVWEVRLKDNLYGRYYGYKVINPEDDPVKKDKIIILDPYAKAVATYNTYMNPRLGLIMKGQPYDWQGDTWIQRDWRDLIIYEMHIRDLTAHPTSGAAKPGTYHGLIEKGKRGGIDYIKSLGVNTIELLPAQEFANIEIPYKDSLHGRFNNWNPYERNHWGYMTAAFFAPEAYYAEDWHHLRWNTWQGADGRAVTHFKDMVKAFHKEGIGVIMDVVYNHLSEYEIGNLKEIDREYYFRLNNDGSFRAESGCGNDLRTEAPMLRRLIVESVLYWMKEYNVDGFRFDLGKLLDWETIETIIREAKKANPQVVFVCEPWGGGYDPAGFSLRGWGAWNDQIRNGIKGENPNNGHGWIFGKWYGNNSPQRIRSYVNGTLVRDSLGLFQKKEHSVNYLESHDGYTLGDFIRIGTGYATNDTVITNVEKFVRLNEKQTKLNKLGALFLFTSQGMVMINSGQEYARSKVIPTETQVHDSHKGKIDHNSYEKDNETNFLNFDHADINKELLDYYRGLISLRNKYDAFRRADYENIKFMNTEADPFTLGYEVKHGNEVFVVLFNANPNKDHIFQLPDTNEYDIITDGNKAGTTALAQAKGSVKVPDSSGMILKKK